MPEPVEVMQLGASIERIWNERDDAKRLAALADIYHPDVTIYEPARVVTGHEAISAVVAAVLADMPPGFRFEVTGPTLGHHGTAVTRWRGVVPSGDVIVSGADSAKVSDGRIIEHFFFFDPSAEA